MKDNLRNFEYLLKVFCFMSQISQKYQLLLFLQWCSWNRKTERTSNIVVYKWGNTKTHSPISPATKVSKNLYQKQKKKLKYFNKMLSRLYCTYLFSPVQPEPENPYVSKQYNYNQNKTIQTVAQHFKVIYALNLFLVHLLLQFTSHKKRICELHIFCRISLVVKAFSFYSAKEML